jgi:hypothetical protein
MMTLSDIGFDHRCGPYDEHGNPQQFDASADAFGAAVRVAGCAACDGLSLPFS